MKHVKTITAQEAPARAVLGNLLGDFSVATWFGFWVDAIQDSLGEWKGLVNGGLNDNVDPEDV